MKLHFRWLKRKTRSSGDANVLDKPRWRSQAALKGSAKKILTHFDRKHRLTERSHDLARKKRILTDHETEDAGRTLEYYRGIHGLFLKWVGDPKGKAVVHLGASTGIYTRFLQEQGSHATAIEVADNLVDIARKLGNNHVIHTTAQVGRKHEQRHLPLESNSVDVFVSDRFLFDKYFSFEGSTIFGIQSLDTLEDMHRALRPRGICIINGVARDFFTDEGKQARARIERMGFLFEVQNKHYSQKHDEQAYIVLRKVAA
jgi:SAM-dependent methyltransferase